MPDAKKDFRNLKLETAKCPTITIGKAMKDKDALIVDVRTPKEFEEAHILNAINIPLMSNYQRHIIGTIYKQESKKAAIKKGWDFFEPVVHDFINQFKKIKDKKIVIYCWRGGMRSRIVVNLLKLFGIKTIQLEGGFKPYMNDIVWAGIKKFENPGGRCLLTDVGYSRKVKDIYENNMFNMEFIKFLTAGRHFRISPEIKLIVGKDNNDNDRIAEQIDKEIVMLCNDFPGPLGVIQGIRKPTDDEVRTCAAILLRYCRKAPESSRVKYGFNHNLINLISCDKMNEEEVKKFQIN